MPAVSAAQQRLMAIAEHDPDKVYPKNAGVLKMKKSQLHDFAVSERKHLPAKAPKNALREIMSGKSMKGLKRRSKG